MKPFVEQDRTISDEAELLALLADARGLIEFSQFDQAMNRYRHLLAQPAIAALPAARAEAMSNLGALLLNQSVPDADDATLDEAVELLHNARALRPAGRRTLPMAIADTNLALGYCRRFQRAGNHADLFAAHLALDGAQMVMIECGDHAALDWLNSVRDLLVDMADRRRQPR